MKIDDEQLKALIRNDKSPGLSRHFLTRTLDKSGFHATRLSLVQQAGNGNKLALVTHLLSHRYINFLLILAILGFLLVKSAIHTEEEELHRIDTLSLSTLLVL